VIPTKLRGYIKSGELYRQILVQVVAAGVRAVRRRESDAKVQQQQGASDRSINKLLARECISNIMNSDLNLYGLACS
jgi:hypothetical protein